MSRKLVQLVAAVGLGVALLVTGCASSPSGGDASGSPSVLPRESLKGKVVAKYEDATTEELRAERETWKKDALLEDVASDISALILLPRDLTIVGRECGAQNAWYSPEEHMIVMCYELSAQERQVFTSLPAQSETVDQLVLNSATATLVHELGHALISELQLATTGREEDVADQLAAYFLTSSPESATSLVATADVYDVFAKEVTSIDQLPFFDEHSLDAQRAVNFRCYAYGAFPEQFQYLVDSGALHTERAGLCQSEYEALKRGWEAQLAPYWK